MRVKRTISSFLPGFTFCLHQSYRLIKSFLDLAQGAGTLVPAGGAGAGHRDSFNPQQRAFRR